MSDDIAACPHSLAERETAVADGMCPICSADALSRRSTPPLPDEIAGLIDHAKQYFHIITRKEMAGEFPQIGLPAYIEKMVSALRALALENERVSTENDTLRNSVDAVRARYLQGVFDEKARADKLEAERDEAKDDYLRRHKDVGDQMDRRIKAEAERDAIRDELHKVASFIEPHWQGAGAKLEADWIVRVVGEMNSEADAIRAKTIEECALEAGKWYPAAERAIRALAQTDEGKTETGE